MRLLIVDADRYGLDLALRSIDAGHEVHILETKEEIIELIETLGEFHPLLNEAIGNYEVGSETFVLKNEIGKVVSINQTRISKAKSSIWRPYANFHLAYTVVDERRKGHAKYLVRAVQAYAIEKGCRRMKSLAASDLGLSLHMSLSHVFWGRTNNHEICIDTPLVKCEGWGSRVPPSVIASKLEEFFLDKESLEKSIGNSPLYWDREENALVDS